MRRFVEDFLIYRRLKIKYLKGNLRSFGKLNRKSEEQIPKKILTAWRNNKWRVVGVLHSNKKNLVQKISLIVPTIDQYGSLKLWAHLDIDDKYCKSMIDGIGNAPTPPQGPSPYTTNEIVQPTSSPSLPRPSQSPPTSPPLRQRTRPSPIPSPRESPTPPQSQTLIYDTEGGVKKEDILWVYSYLQGDLLR